MCPSKERGASHGVGRMSCGHRGSLALLKPRWMRASRERGGGGVVAVGDKFRRGEIGKGGE